MKIIKSSVSVYEVELDIRKWPYSDSAEVPDFKETLCKSLPTITQHKCTSGQHHGFIEELESGTNFAHVVEHVLLELIHLANPEQERHSGWTRMKQDGIYVIHYSAPNFLIGRLAAILAIAFVKQCIKNKYVDLRPYIELLKNPMRYFTRGNNFLPAIDLLIEPNSVIPEIEDSSLNITRFVEPNTLEFNQIKNLGSIFKNIKKHISFINELWKKSFFAYSGSFGKDIVDKIELLNVDKFTDLFQDKDFESFFIGIKNISQVICSYQIPINFVIRSIWIYKNYLLTYVIEEYSNNRNFLHQAINDLEDFYQIIFHNLLEGYSSRHRFEDSKILSELTEFRELKAGKGTILIIDDDPMARRVSSDILQFDGYNTFLAHDGTEALEILTKQGNDVSLVLLDLIMPHMDGKEVYKMIIKLIPNIKVIITSGYPLQKEILDIFNRENVNFIGKPFKVKEFLNQVHRMLNEENKYMNPNKEPHLSDEELGLISVSKHGIFYLKK